MIGLRDFFLHDTGAFIPYGIAVAQVASTSIAGPYRIPNIWVEFKAVYTTDGAGDALPRLRPAAGLLRGRARDGPAGRGAGTSTALRLRRRNFIADTSSRTPREGLVFADGLKVTLDCGQYGEALDVVLAASSDYEDFRAEQERARAEGRYLGFGLACYVEGTGLGPYEGGTSGPPDHRQVYVNTGLTDQGQGHDTVFAQIVGRCPRRLADMIDRGRQATPSQLTGASRRSPAALPSSAATPSTSRNGRAREGAAVAANMLECDPRDLEIENGDIYVKGSRERSVPLRTVATATNPLRYAFDEEAQTATQFASLYGDVTGPPLPEGQAPGLEAWEYYSPPHATWASGVHAAIVEVDLDTFGVEYKRYVCVHDCGSVINPMIVEGQVMGGVAQGVGGALFERLDYDEDGQLTNASFMDFLMPYATEVPRVELHHLETPSPLNALGMKGVGEGGRDSRTRLDRLGGDRRPGASRRPDRPRAPLPE